MKKIIAMLLSFLLIGSMTGCTAEHPIQTSPSPPLPSAGTLSEEELFDLLFDIENKIELQLDMSDEELRKMQADYEKYAQNGSKSPIYRIGNLKVTITTPKDQVYSYTVEEVGIRMKGNTSRTDFYNSFDGIYNIIHLKLSFQETFDDEAYYGSDIKQWEDAERMERKNRTFATLEKLDLRWNRCDDGTYLKEYFAYETYRQNGVLAPHTNLCSFDWAGIHMGVFTINEPVDKVFLSKNLPEEALGGDLYKLGWAGSSNASFLNTNSIGIEDEDEGKFYAYDLKTNKKTSTNEALKKLIRELNDGNVTKENFAELVDLNSFLPYCAVSYLLGNPDDLRNNYNNAYLYFRADNGKAMIIPYDFDRCLGITTHWNPTGDGVTNDNPFGTTLLATGEGQQNPLILYTVAAGGHYVREYAAILENIVSGDGFSELTFLQLYRTAQANYEDDTVPGKAFANAKELYLQFDIDRTSDHSSNGNISIQEYLDAKLKTCHYYLANVEQYTKADVQVKPSWYIRADFTDWHNDDRYAMTTTDGLISIRLSLTREARLKVYNNHTGAWYGTEYIAEECTVPYESDHHSNIVLPAGNYVLCFDPETEVITLE